MSFSKRKPLMRVVGILMVWALTIMSIPVQPVRAAGGQQTDTWEQLLTLPAGSRVRLTFRDGREVQGTLVEARADAVVLKDNRTNALGIAVPPGQTIGDALTFPRGNVSAVEVVPGWPLRKKVAVGVGVAAAVVGVILLRMLFILADQ